MVMDVNDGMPSSYAVPPMPKSPILRLSPFAEAGNRQARELIDKYAELEVVASHHSQNVMNIRAQYDPKFAAMANIIDTLNRWRANPQSYGIDANELVRGLVDAYNSLMMQMNNQIVSLNSDTIRDALVDANYLSDDLS